MTALFSLSTLGVHGRSIASYGLAGAVSRLAPVLILPFLASRLAPTDFSHLVITISAASVMSMVFLAGGHLDLMRSHFNSDDPDIESSLLVIRLVIVGAVAFSVLAIVAPRWAPAAILAIASSVSVLAATKYRATKRVASFSIIETVRTSTVLLGVAMLIVATSTVWRSEWLWQISVFYLMLAVGALWRAGSASIWPSVLQLGKTGALLWKRYVRNARLLPHFVSTSTMVFVERWIVVRYGGEGFINSYIASASGGQLVLAATDVFGKWWQPHALGALSKQQGAIVWRTALGVTATTVLCGLGLFVSYVYLALFVPADLRSYSVAMTAAAAYSTQMFYVFLFPRLLHLDKVSVLGLISPMATLLGCVGFFGLAHSGMSELVPLGYAATFMTQSSIMLVYVNRSKRASKVGVD